ncbi:MAG: clan AA aspartic protease [Planctomycetia bacterium]|nr:clan AA aspartic protease [Planctomycetia bacterium]
MISGVVNTSIEAVLRLVAFDPENAELEFDGVVDTGFSGDLTLPSALIEALGLRWLGIEVGEMADGREELFDVYSGRIMWDGEPRRVEVEAAETSPLIGMNLLLGYCLKINVVPGGTVEIGLLPMKSNN